MVAIGTDARHAKAEGTHLMENPSYQRKTPIVVTEKMRRQIAGAVAEIDLAQT